MSVDASSSSSAVLAAAVVEPLPTTTTTRCTLSFENLSVFVPGKKQSCCSRLFFFRPIVYIAQEYFGMSVQDREPRNVLHNITGLLSSGELCLVLGSNDESKSTLLRALSGRLSRQDQPSGTIALNGLPMKKMMNHKKKKSHHYYQGWRRICPHVGPSDQDHAPVLTVRETLDFARRCTAADADAAMTTTSTSKENNGAAVTSTQNQIIEQDVHKLMVGLGLDHVADTVVGDDNLRGISGGQKRRVTVGEMLLDKTCKFICMENITDGLSSSDSVKLIRDLANVSANNRLLSVLPVIIFNITHSHTGINFYNTAYKFRLLMRADIPRSSPSCNRATKWSNCLISYWS